MLKPKWEYISSEYSDSSHTVVYRDNVLKVQMEILTKRNNHYNPEKAKFFYSMDGEKKTFHTEDELINALSKRFDDVDHQRFSLITHWVRSIED